MSNHGDHGEACPDCGGDCFVTVYFGIYNDRTREEPCETCHGDGVVLVQRDDDSEEE